MNESGMDTQPKVEGQESINNREETTLDEADEANIALLEEQASLDREEEAQLQVEDASKVEELKTALQESGVETKETQAELEANAESVKLAKQLLESITGIESQYENMMNAELFSTKTLYGSLENSLNQERPLEDNTEENTAQSLTDGYNTIVQASREIIHNLGAVVESNWISKQDRGALLREFATTLYSAESEYSKLMQEESKERGEVTFAADSLIQMADSLEGGY